MLLPSQDEGELRKRHTEEAHIITQSAKPATQMNEAGHLAQNSRKTLIAAGRKGSKSWIFT